MQRHFAFPGIPCQKPDLDPTILFCVCVHLVFYSESDFNGKVFALSPVQYIAKLPLSIISIKEMLDFSLDYHREQELNK
jgi:hypothetical protein